MTNFRVLGHGPIAEPTSHVAPLSAVSAQDNPSLESSAMRDLPSDPTACERPSNAGADLPPAVTEPGGATAPGFSSSVHPDELSVIRAPADPSLPSSGSLEADARADYALSRIQNPPFQHSGWAARRRATFYALCATGGLTARAERFASCCSGWWVQRSKSDPAEHRLTLERCHDRLCVPCSRLRAHTASTRLQQYLTQTVFPVAGVRFFTLTLRHSDRPLRDQIDRVYRCFRALRASKPWRAYVRGGFATLEITFNADARQYHVHLHALCSGAFFPHAALKAEWARVTGDSDIVYITAVNHAVDAARYTTKYVTKAFPDELLHDHDVASELIAALAHRRLFLVFGSWKGLALTKPLDDSDWITLGHLAHFLGLQSSLDPADLELAEFLRTHQPDVQAATTFRFTPAARPPPAAAEEHQESFFAEWDHARCPAGNDCSC